MEHKVINIEKDFGRFPAGRYKKDGPRSGEEFREKYLIPALQKEGVEICIEFDGARGLSSSFLEEAFGGLVRAGYKADVLLKRLVFRSKDDTIPMEVKEYIQAQAAV